MEGLMSKAGLGDMYRQRPTDAVRAIENFTTAALAVAINHDPVPFLRALKRVATWSPAGTPNSGTLLIELDDVRSAAAETQVYLEQIDGADSGHLDLVVTLADSHLSQEVWVEVKVNAGLTMHANPVDERAYLDQLQVYMEHRPEHRPGRPDSPFIVTLARKPFLRQDVPGLRWDDMYAEAATARGEMWAELRIFLVEEGIVFPPLPRELGPWESYLAVFDGVNDVMRDMWPHAPGNMHTTGVANTLRRNVDTLHEIYLSAQCLSYGLRMGPDAPEWWITVGDGSDFQRTHVPVEKVIEAAVGGSLDSWTRLGDVRRVDRIDIFEKRRPYTAEAPYATVDWFTVALREVRDSKVIEPYLLKRSLRKP